MSVREEPAQDCGRSYLSPALFPSLGGNRTVFFQIATGNSRQACSVKTKFSTQQQASRYLRQNWIEIEQMARDRLAKGIVDEGCIKLVMIYKAHHCT